MTPAYATKVGIVGAGAIGSAIARHLSRADIEVVLSNSRGPASLAEIARELGALVRPGSIDEAVEPEIVIVAVPWRSLPDVFGRVADWEGRIVIDPTNPSSPNGSLDADLGGRTSSEIVAAMAPGAHVVKAFNALPPAVLAGSPTVAGGRRVIFFSGDHARAKLEVARLIGHLGFAAVDLGDLREGGRLLQHPGGALGGRDLVQIGG